MIFKELAVQNYGNIKNAKIDLDYKGLTFIFGKNKDSGPNATNGAGKSQFWSALPEIAYGTPPTGKDGHKHKNTKIGLKLQAGDHNVTFIKEYNKSGTKKFRVIRDGKDVNVRTLDYAETQLQKYLGKTEEDFYTKVYVDSLKVHPLIVGSPAVRQEFFVRMFDLENVDNIRKLLLAELAEVQKVAASYREVKALFDDARAALKLDRKGLASLVEEIEELRAKRDGLLDRSQKIQKLRDLVSFGRDNKALIDRLNKVSSTKTFEEDLTSVKQKVKKLRAKQQVAADWAAYDKAIAPYKKALAKIEAQCRELLGTGLPDTKEVSKRSSKYLESRSELKVAERKLQELIDELKALSIEKVDKPKHDLDTCKAKVSNLTEELEHAHEFKNGKCPTCGSQVEARSKEEIEEELAKWKARSKQAKAYLEYAEKKKARSDLESKITAAEEKLTELRKTVVKYKPYQEVHQLLSDLPTKPEKPEEGREDKQEVEERLEKAQKSLAVLESVADLVPMIAKFEALTDEDLAKVNAADKIGQRLTELNEVLTKKEAFRNQQEEAFNQLDKMRARGKALQKQAEDEVVLKTLVNAYSTKGLKKLMIQRYASLLERQVNKFVRFTFSEDFSFEFKYDKRLEVLVHRKYGKSVKTSDVKRLSGAEKRMFTLLLVIATYTLTPAKRRSNILVLDEMEANMGPEAIQNFLRALPVLNKIVPHIVVITPNPSLHIDGARFFTAVKQRGVTTLVEGKA